MIDKPTRDKIRELINEYPVEYRNERRIEFYKGKMTDEIVEAWYHMARYDDYKARYRPVEMILTSEMIVYLCKQIAKRQGAIIALRGRMNEITEEMKDRARSYPFEQLHNFKRNMALCPFHEDKTPSMSLKNNRVRCWSCGESWDTIGFVMKKDGISFFDAIKQLQ